MSHATEVGADRSTFAASPPPSPTTLAKRFLLSPDGKGVPAAEVAARFGVTVRTVEGLRTGAQGGYSGAATNRRMAAIRRAKSSGEPTP